MTVCILSIYNILYVVQLFVYSFGLFPVLCVSCFLKIFLICVFKLDIFEYRPSNTSVYNLYLESYHSSAVKFEGLKNHIIIIIDFGMSPSSSSKVLKWLCINYVSPCIWSAELESLMRYWTGKAETSILVLMLKHYFNEQINSLVRH